MGWLERWVERVVGGELDGAGREVGGVGGSVGGMGVWV